MEASITFKAVGKTLGNQILLADLSFGVEMFCMSSFHFHVFLYTTIIVFIYSGAQNVIEIGEKFMCLLTNSYIMTTK